MEKLKDIHSFQILPVNGMKGYRKLEDNKNEYYFVDIIAIKIIFFNDGLSSWYPINIDDIACDMTIDPLYGNSSYDWIEYNGNKYGDGVPFNKVLPYEMLKEKYKVSS